MTPRDREILLLWDAGLSYPEIAAQTGLAVGAVGTTLARARRRLVEARPATRAQQREPCGTLFPPKDGLRPCLDRGTRSFQCVEIECHLAACAASCQASRDGIAALRDRTTALLARLAPPRSFPTPFETLRRRADLEVSARRRRLMWAHGRPASWRRWPSAGPPVIGSVREVRRPLGFRHAGAHTRLRFPSGGGRGLGPRRRRRQFSAHGH